MKYRAMKSFHMQECIDSCGKGYSTQANIKKLFGHLDKFAFELDIIDKMYSQLITVSEAVPETTRTPFTQDQVNELWKLQDQGEPWVDTVLMYLYTGFRLNELLSLRVEQIDLEKQLLQGGLKTEAGKNRIIPIHPRILPLIQKRVVDQGNVYLISSRVNVRITYQNYYKHWNPIMKKLGIDKTPHEARHTFETFLDNANANRKCIDLLMGHKSSDIGNRVYNHKTIEQLRNTILLLK